MVMVMLLSRWSLPHPEERRVRRVSKDEEIIGSWFETALARLLTMRATP
jgi:hypothetical protein